MYCLRVSVYAPVFQGMCVRVNLMCVCVCAVLKCVYVHGLFRVLVLGCVCTGLECVCVPSESLYMFRLRESACAPS